MIPKDTPPGTELRSEHGTRTYYLVQWRPRRPIVSAQRSRGAGYHEWSVDQQHVRLPTPEEVEQTTDAERHRSAMGELDAAVRELRLYAARRSWERIEDLTRAVLEIVKE